MRPYFISDRGCAFERVVIRCLVITALSLCGSLWLAGGSRAASAPGPHWTIVSASAPTYFKPGDTADEFLLTVMNSGGGATLESNVSVTDELPSGLTATSIAGVGGSGHNEPLACSLTTVSCTDPREVVPGETLNITITVSVDPSLRGSVSNAATVAGGGAPNASVRTSTSISSLPVPFGLAYFETELTDASGNLDTQAGSHPYEMTTQLGFNVGGLDSTGFPSSNAVMRDLDVALPPGLVGDPNAVPQCSQRTFQTVASFFGCPTDTQVGTLSLLFYGNGTAEQTVPIYNVTPLPGQPAELGFTVASFVHEPLLFHVRADGDYGLTAQIRNITEADPVRATILKLWGVPAEHSHDPYREGPNCASGCESHLDPRPFLTLPTQCSTDALSFTVSADSWQAPGSFNPDGTPVEGDPNWRSLPPFTTPGLMGCRNLSVSPVLSVRPDTAQSGAPAGYTDELRIPQNDDPSGLVAPAVKKVVVALPPEALISPSAANGLGACSDNASTAPGDQFGLHTSSLAACPNSSQIGTIKVTTPLLSLPLEGQVFLGDPECAPCSPSDAQQGKMIRLLVQAEGSGVVVKFEGRVAVNPASGQLTATFENTPQLPFSDLILSLTGGARAALTNPLTCGLATATGLLSPWSTPFEEDAIAMSSFEVTGCQNPIPFLPTMSAGTVTNRAGAFSPLTFTLSRSDSDQMLNRLSVKTPPGLLGIIAQVPRCGEPQATLGTCSDASLIGTTTAASGAGPDPYYLPGKVFLTGAYGGGPFGLSVVVPAVAGPFNLGTVVVRASISVDPHTSQLSVLSDPLPRLIDGIPVTLKLLNVTIDRPHFIFNPTRCTAQSISATVQSTAGAAVALSSPFVATGCKSLAFKPRFSATTRGKAARNRNGASLKVAITAKGGPSAGGEANIAQVDVQLPKLLSARLTTLQKACTAAQFEANPAGCPRASDVGTAVAHTPILGVPLTGPAYLVSHGGAAFPDLDIVLQGEGVTVVLSGRTDIKGATTYSRFNTVPDAPITSFSLNLPVGPYSVLAAPKGNLCGKQLLMPTTIIGQNGVKITQTTKIGVTGCPKPKPKRRKAAPRDRAADTALIRRERSKR